MRIDTVVWALLVVGFALQVAWAAAQSGRCGDEQPPEQPAPEQSERSTR